jgi:hypothetical protein
LNDEFIRSSWHVLPGPYKSGIAFEFKMKILSYIALFAAITVHAQLSITVLPTKVVGQKAIVTLAMTNNLARSVESAHAVCFLLDDQGKMVGQSTKWVIGGIKDRPALQPKSGTTFNFVISSPQPWATTNFTPKISFSRVLLDGGKQADVSQDVVVTSVDRR